MFGSPHWQVEPLPCLIIRLVIQTTEGFLWIRLDRRGPQPEQARSSGPPSTLIPSLRLATWALVQSGRHSHQTVSGG